MIWASPVTLTLSQIAKLIKEGNAHIPRVLGMGIPKTRGCPYHCNTGSGKVFPGSGIIKKRQCGIREAFDWVPDSTATLEAGFAKIWVRMRDWERKRSVGMAMMEVRDAVLLVFSVTPFKIDGNKNQTI